MIGRRFYRINQSTPVRRLESRRIHIQYCKVVRITSTTFSCSFCTKIYVLYAQEEDTKRADYLMRTGRLVYYPFQQKNKKRGKQLVAVF